jgi:hypothetical protein
MAPVPSEPSARPTVGGAPCGAAWASPGSAACYSTVQDTGTSPCVRRRHPLQVARRPISSLPGYGLSFVELWEARGCLTTPFSTRGLAHGRLLANAVVALADKSRSREQDSEMRHFTKGIEGVPPAHRRPRSVHSVCRGEHPQEHWLERGLTT